MLAATDTNAGLVAGVAFLGVLGTLAGAFVGPLVTAKWTARREQDARRAAAQAAADERQLATLLELQEALSRLLLANYVLIFREEEEAAGNVALASARVTELTQRIRSPQVRAAVADVAGYLDRLTRAHFTNQDVYLQEDAQAHVDVAHAAVGEELRLLDHAWADRA